MEYKITNAFISASIKDFGAELCSLKRNAVDTEYIWQADRQYWGRHAPVLFPIVGKLLDDEYIYKDKTYKMSQHGFARDSLFEVLEHKKNYITFKLVQNVETLKQYPFRFKLYISYTLLENCLKISYKIVNKSDDIMPFSIGGHPAFNWPLEDERKNDSYFSFRDTDSLIRLPLTTDGILNEKEDIPLEDGKLLLSKKTFKDDALVIKNLKDKTILFENSLNDKYIKVEFNGFKYLGLWSKPTGAPFICIEPWNGIADLTSHNKNIEEKKGIKLLGTDEVFECSYNIEI